MTAAGPVAARRTHGFRRLTVTGLVATPAAMVATTLTAALAQAGGVDFVVTDVGETIPPAGFAAVTGPSRSWASSSPSRCCGGALARPSGSWGRR